MSPRMPDVESQHPSTTQSDIQFSGVGPQSTLPRQSAPVKSAPQLTRKDTADPFASSPDNLRNPPEPAVKLGAPASPTSPSSPLADQLTIPVEKVPALDQAPAFEVVKKAGVKKGLTSAP